MYHLPSISPDQGKHRLAQLYCLSLRKVPYFPTDYGYYGTSIIRCIIIFFDVCIARIHYCLKFRDYKIVAMVHTVVVTGSCHRPHPTNFTLHHGIYIFPWSSTTFLSTSDPHDLSPYIWLLGLRRLRPFTFVHT